MITYGACLLLFRYIYSSKQIISYKMHAFHFHIVVKTPPQTNPGICSKTVYPGKFVHQTSNNANKLMIWHLKISLLNTLIILVSRKEHQQAWNDSFASTLFTYSTKWCISSWLTFQIPTTRLFCYLPLQVVMLYVHVKFVFEAFIFHLVKHAVVKDYCFL